MLPEPLSVRVVLPEGATVVSATEGARVANGRVTYQTSLTTDLELAIRYTLP
jgi:hypothetical protein